MERAYLDMEPEAMYILGASACLKALGDTSFNRIYTVPLDQAETMLWIAADELQFQPARDLILYLDDLGAWPLSIPNEK